MMGSRFTNPGKWDNPWFRSLPTNLKLFWLYLCDRCDWAGIWRVDPERVRFESGLKIDCETPPEEFGGRVKNLNDGHWWLRTFLEQQKNLPLNQENRAHKPIIASLLEHGVYEDAQSPFEAPSKPLARGTGIGIGNSKGKKGESEGGTRRANLMADFEVVWKRYPNKTSKIKSRTAYLKARANGIGRQDVEDGLDRYLAYVEANRSRGFDLQYRGGERWFGGQGWADEYTPPKTRGKSAAPASTREPWQINQDIKALRTKRDNLWDRRSFQHSLSREQHPEDWKRVAAMGKKIKQLEAALEAAEV